MILHTFVLLDTYLFSLEKLLFRPFSIFKFSVFGCKGSLYIVNTSPLLNFLVCTFLVVFYKAQTEEILKLCQTTFLHKIIKNQHKPNHNFLCLMNFYLSIQHFTDA